MAKPSPNRRYTRRRASSEPPFIEQSGDCLAEAVLDYVYNLAAAGALTADHVEGYDDACRVVRRIVAREGTASERRMISEARSPDEGVARALFALLRRMRHRKRPPALASEPVRSNLLMVGQTLGFHDSDLAVLQFALAGARTDVKRTLDPIPCEGARSPAILTAVALNAPVDKIEAALDPKGRLVSSGLVTLSPHGDLDDRVKVDERLERLVFTPSLDKATFVREFLPTAPPSSLASADFAHLHTELATARRLLAAALDGRKAGVNLLLYGPTGTGKSELARFLCGELGVPLFVAGREDAEGQSPNAHERLTSLVLGNKLLCAGRHALLFDEMEDLFERSVFAEALGGRPGMDKRLMSKQWFNLVLETNPVPTIWISNRIAGMDPAFLRRFSYVVEVADFTAAQRRRAWTRHLGSQSPLPAPDLDLLAQRFEVSPAHIATAVAAARLVSDGQPDRATLETILRPAERILHGHKAPPPVFHADRYLPELVNTPADLDAIEKRVVAWRPGPDPGLSLCLYGPPGTGKSEFVRYLAHRAGRPLLVKRASDLISMWVGQTEARIAAAFDEARRDEAVLLFDEADSFLQDRRGAQRTWEITEVNEFLQQLEVFPGIVVCTTNLMETLDQAALRRFVFKVPFRFLRGDQAVLAFRRLLAEVGGGADVPEAVEAKLRRMGNVAPGDFAAVARRMRGTESGVGAQALLAEVEAEVGVKENATRTERVGF